MQTQKTSVKLFCTLLEIQSYRATNSFVNFEENLSVSDLKYFAAIFVFQFPVLLFCLCHTDDCAEMEAFQKYLL